MKEIKKFPKMVGCLREMELNRTADRFVKEYESFIYPILFQFGLLDDEHIKKYLASKSAEDIYLEAMSLEGDKWEYLERQALFDEIDIWGKIRDKSSPVKSPKEEGFVFVNFPYYDSKNRDVIINSISVKNSKLYINKEFLEEASIIKPTEKQEELYDLIANFCEEVNKKNYQKRNVPQLMYMNEKGKIIPNIRGILGVTVCSEKRK